MSTPTPPGIGLSRLLDYPLARFPDKLAYIDDREAITFAELELRAARLARAFSQAGAGAARGTAGDRVAARAPSGLLGRDRLPNSIAFARGDRRNRDRNNMAAYWQETAATLVGLAAHRRPAAR